MSCGPAICAAPEGAGFPGCSGSKRERPPVPGQKCELRRPSLRLPNERRWNLPAALRGARPSFPGRAQVRAPRGTGNQWPPGLMSLPAWLALPAAAAATARAQAGALCQLGGCTSGGWGRRDGQGRAPPSWSAPLRKYGDVKPRAECERLGRSSVETTGKALLRFTV